MQAYPEGRGELSGLSSMQSLLYPLGMHFPSAIKTSRPTEPEVTRRGCYIFANGSLKTFLSGATTIYSLILDTWILTVAETAPYIGH